MKCPEPISKIIVSILTRGILEARAAAWSGDAKLCAALLDHIHNLPDLLVNFSNERIAYYMDVERPAFIDVIGGEESSIAYARDWDDLRAHCCNDASFATVRNPNPSSDPPD